MAASGGGGDGFRTISSIARVMSAAARASHRYRLTYLAETNYVEVGDVEDLLNFQGSNDPYMHEVHAARDTYGADLMALVVETAGVWCGRSYQMNFATTNFGAFAFSLTVRACLSGHTMTHELGHTMGCQHDRPNAPYQGVYPYSYGARTLNSQFRSLMAYPPGIRLNLWSGPNSSHAGMPLGNPPNDNARSLTELTPIIAAFWPTRTYEWIPVPGGIPGSQGQPTLAGQGTRNQVVPVRLTIGNTPAGAPGALLLGTSAINTPLLGGTIVPNPEVSLPLVGSASSIELDFSGLSGLPSGTEIYLQALFLDGGAVRGVSASDGLMVPVP